MARSRSRRRKLYVHDRVCGRVRVSSKVRVGRVGSKRQRAYCARSAKIRGGGARCGRNQVQRRRWKCSRTRRRRTRRRSRRRAMSQAQIIGLSVGVPAAIAVIGGVAYYVLTRNPKETLTRGQLVKKLGRLMAQIRHMEVVSLSSGTEAYAAHMKRLESRLKDMRERVGSLNNEEKQYLQGQVQRVENAANSGVRRGVANRAKRKVTGNRSYSHRRQRNKT